MSETILAFEFIFNGNTVKSRDAKVVAAGIVHDYAILTEKISHDERT